MINILEQSLIVLPNLTTWYQDPDIAFDEFGDFDLYGKIPCRIPNKTATSLKWKLKWQLISSSKEVFLPIPLDLSFQGELDAIARLELTPHGTWELGCFYTEELIQSNSERPHFERILIVVDRTTKYALMAEILSEKDTDMELIQKLLQLFKKIKLLPKNLMVPTNALATLL